MVRIFLEGISMRYLLGVALFVATAGSASAAQAVLEKDAVVLLKAPMSAFEPVKKGGGLMGIPSTEWTATVEPAPSGGALINGKADWQTIGFPSMREYRVAKVKRDQKTGIDVEMKPTGDAWSRDLRLHFPTNIGGLFGDIFADRSDRIAYKKTAYAALSAGWTGQLGELTTDQRVSLLSFVDAVNGTGAAATTYKDKSYLVMKLSGDGNTYNELKLNQNQRIARTMNESLLAIVKSAQPLLTESGMHGLKIETSISHKDFMKTYAVSDEDRVELYVPGDVLKRFCDADITSQQLLDGSVVIVNNNRVQVPLTGS
jgi:hypothetical protein